MNEDIKEYYSEDELYDFKEVAGEDWARLKFLTQWLKKQLKEEEQELVKVVEWE